MSDFITCPEKTPEECPTTAIVGCATVGCMIVGVGVAGPCEEEPPTNWNCEESNNAL